MGNQHQLFLSVLLSTAPVEVSRRIPQTHYAVEYNKSNQYALYPWLDQFKKQDEAPLAQAYKFYVGSSANELIDLRLMLDPQPLASFIQLQVPEVLSNMRILFYDEAGGLLSNQELGELDEKLNLARNRREMYSLSISDEKHKLRCIQILKTGA